MNMGDFYKKNLLETNRRQWVDFLDWIFDESKFLEWDLNKKNEYTKKIKKIDGFVAKDYHTKMSGLPNKHNRFMIYMTVANGSQGVALAKHIRNSFAHGLVKIRHIKKQEYMELCDFYQKNQTAYMLVQYSFVFKLKDVYDSINKPKKCNA